MDEKDKCKKCNGKKIMDQKKTLEVAVEAGVPDKHDIIMHSEGDEQPGIHAGDLYFRVTTEKHAVFSRKGADLFMDKQISLLEALLGVSFIVKTLDKTDL